MRFTDQAAVARRSIIVTATTTRAVSPVVVPNKIAPTDLNGVPGALASFFCLNYGLHLFMDCITSTTIGFVNSIKELVNFNKAPGNLLYIKGKKEKIFLTLNYIICFIMFGLGIYFFYNL